MSNKKSGTKNQPELPPFHPIAELFPLLQGEEFQELAGDIHRRGLKLPIWMYQNQVLDGRNRVRACAKAGYVLRAEDIRQFEGTDEEAVRFVMSMNIHRRQLMPNERRELIKKLLKMNPTLSSNAVAGMAKASPHTVESVRREKSESNLQNANKDPRLEKSGRKARGRKPGTGKPAKKAKKRVAGDIGTAIDAALDSFIDGFEDKAEAAPEPTIVPEAPQPPIAGPTLYCSFCGKSQHAVRTLVTSPIPIADLTAAICDGCVEVCVQTIQENRARVTELEAQPAAAGPEQSELVAELAVASAQGKIVH
jgi:ParB-like chromosome segregation protein Spo0J